MNPSNNLNTDTVDWFINDENRHGRRHLYRHLFDVYRQDGKKETTCLHVHRIDNRHDSAHGVYKILRQQYKQSWARFYCRLDLRLLVHLLARVRLSGTDKVTYGVADFSQLPSYPVGLHCRNFPNSTEISCYCQYETLSLLTAK